MRRPGRPGAGASLGGKLTGHLVMIDTFRHERRFEHLSRQIDKAGRRRRRTRTGKGLAMVGAFGGVASAALAAFVSMLPATCADTSTPTKRSQPWSVPQQPVRQACSGTDGETKRFHYRHGDDYEGAKRIRSVRCSTSLVARVATKDHPTRTSSTAPAPAHAVVAGRTDSNVIWERVGEVTLQRYGQSALVEFSARRHIRPWFH